MNVLTIGGSRNIGYFSALRLLRKQAHVTFLLRNPACFDSDEEIQSFVKSGHAILVKGDALNKADVDNVIATSMKATDVILDTIIFTVGGFPQMSLTKGFALPIPDICTRSMLILQAALRSNPQLASSPPKLIVVTSMGIGKEGRENVPCLLKPLHKVLLTGPHEDKMGLERVVAEAAGFEWNEGVDEVKTSVLPPGWEASVGDKGWMKDRVVVIRPSLLTDGKAKGEKSDAYRVAAAELPKAYTISRQDVAHCIVEKVMADWEEYKGKALRVTY